MVVIRLSRGGAKKRPFYNIVVADSRQARDGRYIERVGYFNPIAKGGETRLSVEEERVTYWTSQGAQPSDRVSHLLEEFETQKEAAGEQKVETKKTKTAKTSAKKEQQAKESE